jgi:type IV secretory pathway VirB10-like protein
MPKLKAFTTTAGFFDLAVAAPSMKAALEAWGAGSNLFHQGFAKESRDFDVVTATMAQPGVVLRRQVGTNGQFTRDATVSDSFVGRDNPPKRKTTPAPPKSADRKTDRKAALAYAKQAERRERQKRQEEVAQQKERERREKAIAAAESSLQQAEEAHDQAVKDIEKAQVALDRKAADEKARWERQKEKLQDALREARTPRHLRLIS